ncbi:MAG: glycoside hydrolase family 2 TIM barrel-domain containing protein [Fimbriimonadaceae bacterium]|nr:glycoside hydrolase family 2 TIM barrel-domain containing protein [Fimbriimonadaceae bacterium]
MLGILATLLCNSGPAPAGPIRTEIIRRPNGQYELRRAGKPMFVRGAGAQRELAKLRAAGANSIRTWGSGPDVDKLLDEAHSNGLSVCVGIWLGHKEHGFNYDDPKQVADQYAAAMRDVRRIRNHPAVLMWAVGNEMELAAPGAKTWQAVEQIAAAIQREDPNHPVISVVADMWPEKMADILKYAPSLDALGINSYGGLPTLASRMSAWKKPYFITEFQAPIQQQAAQTPWKTPIEPSSTEKAAILARDYQRVIRAQPGRILGSYLFYWGKSSVATASWFDTFLRSGEKLAAVDEIQRAWTGKYPANRAPAIALRTPVSSSGLAAGTSVPLTFTVRDPDGDPVSVKYEVLSDDPKKRFVGDFEKEMKRFGKGVARSPLSVRVPSEAGPYRVVIVARDGKGSAAAASWPFMVNP